MIKDLLDYTNLLASICFKNLNNFNLERKLSVTTGLSFKEITRKNNFLNS